jgi:threonine/homoserine/homoserine lactone efflux protein
MFATSDLTLMALGVAIVLLTPGPTNTLLAAAGLRQGVKRSVPLILAELAGYLVAISVWGRFLISASHTVPGLAILLRVLSGLYIAYLALKMWRTAAALSPSDTSPIGLRTLFVATLFNPKGLLFAGTLFPASAFLSWYGYVSAMTVFGALMLPIALAWITFGAVLGRGGLSWVNPVKMQRGASIVLGAFSLSLAWAAFHS